jgi:SpoVK/Ycf46/Vps4 family AAA+-type ATPase
MAGRSPSIYQGGDALERAVVDLVRVGARGHAAGVRQLAGRLIRSVPAQVTDMASFRDAVHDALVEAKPTAGLRFDAGAIPADAEGEQPLVDVDAIPVADELVVDSYIASELDEIVAERRRAEELARAGVSISRTVLFAGPPGVGKTLASRWIAQRLGLPLVTLDLATVVSSYLGASGRNLKSVLAYAKSGPCVLLLDEFDAVAKRRDDETDIGELKRIVNVILVELDRWPDMSLLIAATNHPQLLDAAIDRRFDRVINFPPPGATERLTLLQNANQGQASPEVVALAADLWAGQSHSVIIRFWELCRRKAVLHDLDLEEAVVTELIRQFPSGERREQLWRHANEQLAMSNRRIAALAGVSHPTISTGIRRAKGKQ